MLKNKNMVKDTFIIETKHQAWLRKNAYKNKTNKSKILRNVLTKEMEQK